MLAKPLTSMNATIAAISSKPRSTTNQVRRCLGRAGVDVSMHEYYRRSVPPVCAVPTLAAEWIAAVEPICEVLGFFCGRRFCVAMIKDAINAVLGIRSQN